MFLQATCSFAFCIASFFAADGGPAETDCPDAPAYVSRRELQLQFKIEQRGAAEVTGFDLYFSTDGGNHWQIGGRDRHFGESPFPFLAPSDGYFGFYLTARDAAGSESPEPPPGTPPQAEVIVDTAPPDIRILKPLPGEWIAPAGFLDLAWEVRDENLAPYSVEAAYSLDGGPWEEICADAETAGSRKWKPPFTEGSLSFRLRCRDNAGNLGEAKLAEPLTLSAANRAPAAILIVAPRSRRLTVPVYYRIPASTEEVSPGSGGEADGDARDPQFRKVQLWFRRAGEAWEAGDLDIDRVSPVYFQAPEDGQYELLILAEASPGDFYPRGLVPDGQEAPLPGSQPHGSVLIDTLEPQIRIIEPPEGARIDFKEPLRIRFEVSEAHPLQELPAIRYSLDGGDRWEDIGAPLSWTPLKEKGNYLGECRLQLPAMRSDSFMLEIAQKDIAGNVGRATTGKQPLRIADLLEDPRQEAEKEYRKALLLLNQGDDDGKRRSIAFFEAALDRWEPFAEAHHDLAVALEQTSSGKGDLRDALDHYRRSLEIDPARPAIRFHLIRFLLSLSKNSRFPVDERNDFHDEASRHYSQINWLDLLNAPDAGGDELELRRFRNLYLLWKEKEFQEKK